MPEESDNLLPVAREQREAAHILAFGCAKLGTDPCGPN
jgi:hypothetical protein